MDWDSQTGLRKKKASSRPKSVRSHVRAREPARTKKEETKKRTHTKRIQIRGVQPTTTAATVQFTLVCQHRAPHWQTSHSHTRTTHYTRSHTISLAHSLSSSHAHEQHTLLHYMTIFRVRMLVGKYIDSARAE